MERKSRIKTYLCLAFGILLSSCGPSSEMTSYWSSYGTSETSSSVTSEPTSAPTSASTSVSSTETAQSFDLETIYDGYYSSLTSWDNGADLKNKLHSLIHGGTYQPLTFTDPNYESNTKADHTANDLEMLDVIYSGEDCAASRTNVGWQREHCFPASLMTGSITGNANKYPGRATDFHNLWAAAAGANSSRGNKNYGIPDSDDPDYRNRMTEDGLEGYACDPENFEPGDNDKGIVSRSIFYMATMYTEDDYDKVNGVTMKGLKIVDYPVSFGEGNLCQFAIGGLSTLLEWSEFPVSDLEAQHNHSVYSDKIAECEGKAQGNRNPYVDFPELVDYVYGSKANEAGSLSDLTPSIVSLGRLEEGIHDFAIKSAKRKYNYGETFSVSDVTVVTIGNDFTQTTYSDVTSSFEGHVFSSTDGDEATIEVNAGGHELSYKVALNKAGECNTVCKLIKDNFSTTTVNVDKQFTSENGVKWIGNVNAASGYSLTNDNTRQGIKFGSGTKPVSGITLTTVDEYEIDAVFVEAFLGNKSSAFSLDISVGGYKIGTYQIGYNDGDFATYGMQLPVEFEGQIQIKFAGSNSLELRNISFNVVE